ncbi:MAG: prepilin-type N-terminal cleavage/methylation domain-containing protein [Planctomycetota bacterium]
MIGQAQRRRPFVGFTLVELVVVIMVLGILAGVAAPKLLSFSAESEAAAILTNVRSIFDAVELAAARDGSLPPDVSRGTAPPELDGMLPPALFTQPSPLGGEYDWNGPGSPLASYGVSIRVSGGATVANRETYRAMERMADDGVATSGWITVTGQQVLFSLSANPSPFGGVPITGTPVTGTPITGPPATGTPPLPIGGGS